VVKQSDLVRPAKLEKPEFRLPLISGAPSVWAVYRRTFTKLSTRVSKKLSLFFGISPQRTEKT